MRRIVLLFALCLVSCAPFYYGTGRFNPIVIQSGWLASIRPNERFYVRLDFPNEIANQLLTAPMLAAENTFSTSQNEKLEFNSNDIVLSSLSTPSGWGGASGGTNVQIGVSRSTIFKNNSSQRYNLRLETQSIISRLNFDIPRDASQGNYNLAGAWLSRQSGYSESFSLQVNVSNNAPSANTFRVGNSGSLSLRPGQNYTLIFVQRGNAFLPDATNLYLSRFNDSSNTVGINTNQFEVTELNVPNNFNLELLERNMQIQIDTNYYRSGNNFIEVFIDAGFKGISTLWSISNVSASPFGNDLVSGRLRSSSTGETRDFNFLVQLEGK
jgi:hypothetical protein